MKVSLEVFAFTAKQKRPKPERKKKMEGKGREGKARERKGREGKCQVCRVATVTCLELVPIAFRQ